MQRYFIEDNDFQNLTITNDDAFHITNVMRMSVTDQFIIIYQQKNYLCEIISIFKSHVAFKIIKELKNNTELEYNITIIQGMPKGDKLEFIVQKITELGASSIISVMMKRSIVKLDHLKKNKKVERLQKIAKEAAEQSYRNFIPKVEIIDKIEDMVFSNYQHKLIAYEETAKEGKMQNLKKILKSIKKNENVAILIGPEGGINPDEYQFLQKNGFISCALGKRIMRTETASSYFLSAFSYEHELED